MIELRRLQTERQIRLRIEGAESFGLADTEKIARTVELAAPDNAEAEPQTEAPQQRVTLADLEKLMSLADQKLCADIRNENPSSFCKATPSASSQPAAQPAPSRQSVLEALRNARNRAA